MTFGIGICRAVNKIIGYPAAADCNIRKGISADSVIDCSGKRVNSINKGDVKNAGIIGLYVCLT